MELELYRMLMLTAGGQEETKVLKWKLETDTNASGRQFASSAYSPTLGLTVFVPSAFSGVVRSVSNAGVWSSVNLSAGNCYAVIWTGSMFVISGVSTFISTDGITWTQRTVATAAAPPTGYRAIATNGSIILFAGDNGKVTSSSNNLSTNVMSFGDMGTTANPSNLRINGLIWHPGLSLFIAVGASGFIATSPTGAINGTSWTSRTSGTTQELRAITFNPITGLIVVVGAGGIIRTSTDGVTWTSRTNPSGAPTTYNTVICDGKGMFLAAGSVGTNVIISEDGITWTVNPINFPTPITSLVYNSNNDVHFASGHSGSDTSGRIYSSFY